MRETLGGVRPEAEFCAEDGLALETGALADEQMVVVALERLFVDVEDFRAEVEGEGAVRPTHEAGI